MAYSVVKNNVAVIFLNNPPVNALSFQVRKDVGRLLKEAESNSEVGLDKVIDAVSSLISKLIHFVTVLQPCNCSPKFSKTC